MILSDVIKSSLPNSLPIHSNRLISSKYPVYSIQTCNFVTLNLVIKLILYISLFCVYRDMKMFFKVF